MEKKLKKILSDYKKSFITLKVYSYDKNPHFDNLKSPKEFLLKEINDEFIKNCHLENRDEIDIWINSCWKDRSNFLENGIGFCLINISTIASWCFSDFIYNNKCEVSIETDEEYQRQGLTTITAKAFINKCSERKLEVL